MASRATPVAPNVATAMNCFRKLIPSALMAGMLFWLAADPRSAYGDAPLPGPVRHTVCAPSNAFCVTSDPESGTFAHAPDASIENRSWSMEGWFRVIYVSDDPEILVTGFDGVNLVPLEAPGEVEILHFWRNGKLVRSYTLDQLVRNLRSLKRTVSHYHWGNYLGFDKDGKFRLRTAEEWILVFDARTGALVKRLRSPE